MKRSGKRFYPGVKLVRKKDSIQGSYAVIDAKISELLAEKSEKISRKLARASLELEKEINNLSYPDLGSKKNIRKKIERLKAKIRILKREFAELHDRKGNLA
jgi:hypothetical protein